MRTILIAPDLADQDLLVQELETADGLQAIYDRLDCNLIDTVRLNEQGDVMYVDDEGYMTKNTFFRFGSYPMPLAGRGLIVGTNMLTGESQSTSTTLNTHLIRSIVKPLTPAEAYQMAKEQDDAAKQSIKDNNQESFHIYVSVSEIMEGAWYSDQLELET